MELTNLNPPHSYTISGEGKGGIAGFAKGGADVSLAEDGPTVTILTYSVKADVGGKIAQLGARLIDLTREKAGNAVLQQFRQPVCRTGHPERQRLNTAAGSMLVLNAV